MTDPGYPLVGSIIAMVAVVCSILLRLLSDS